MGMSGARAATKLNSVPMKILDIKKKTSNIKITEYWKKLSFLLEAESERNRINKLSTRRQKRKMK